MASRIRSTLSPSDHQLLPRLERGGDGEAPHSRNGLALVRLKRKWPKRSPLKKQSKGLKAEQAKYRKLSAIFLAQPENSWCICCTLRREKLGENILRNQAAEIHHWAGRIKKLLCYVPYFRAFCYRCRDWPHLNKIKARELGLLAPAHLWEVYPGEY